MYPCSACQMQKEGKFLPHFDDYSLHGLMCSKVHPGMWTTESSDTDVKIEERCAAVNTSMSSGRPTWSLHPLPAEYLVMVDPSLIQLALLPAPPVETPPETTGSYHPSMDHDYSKICTEDGNCVEREKHIGKDEPAVDIGEKENFNSGQASTSHGVSESQAVKNETPYTSRRAAKIRRTEEKRKKSGHVLQNKNIKLKNRLPEHDIEETYRRPLRQKNTKITEKITSKTKTDHNESERQRRKILGSNFHLLSSVIPAGFLKSEIRSSQISKQKLLNAAKSYIVLLKIVISSYMELYHQHKLLIDKLRKLRKSLKKRK